MIDLLIGTLTRMGGAGICYVRINHHCMTQLWADDSLTDPNWQLAGPNGHIFSVSNSGAVPMNGCVHELQISPDGMKLLSTQPTGGNEPCYLTLSEGGRYLLCANYGNGSLAVFPLLKEGIGERIQLVQHSGSGPHPTRQTGPHLHQITRIPHLPGCFCAVDLGLDELFVYKQDENGLLHECYRVAVPAGQGPRHVAYGPHGTAFLVTELGNRVYPVLLGNNGGHVIGEGVSTLERTDTPNTAAALWLSSDGTSLYASNRGEGSIVRFTPSPLKKEQAIVLPGREPRDFCLLEKETLVAACQDQGLYLVCNGETVDFLPCPGAVRVIRL